jgi:hypothetical protein
VHLGLVDKDKVVSTLSGVVQLQWELHRTQTARWPATGRHIMASYDADEVVVYQAYRPSIGRYAAEHGRFGGADFSFGRMSWIKPNFLWMMYRSGWGTKSGQEVTLAVHLKAEHRSNAAPSSLDYAATCFAAMRKNGERIERDQGQGELALSQTLSHAVFGS